ncbi:MAG: hypothetical protein H6727_14935 [Myxococcales bacterium]|nr:hypothetical protein [Myxococcales bacterium]
MKPQTKQQEQSETKKLVYVPPTIHSEPMFESNALESTGKSAQACADYEDPRHDACQAAGCSGS